MIITDEYMATVQPRKRHYTMRDERTPGFTMRVLTSGCITLWHEKVTKGKKVRTRLGVYPSVDVDTARARCEALNARAAATPRPKKRRPPAASQSLSERQLSLLPLGPLIADFKESHMGDLARNTRTQYDAMLRRIAVDYPGTSHLQSRNVRIQMDAMQDTPTAANRYLAVLSVFCRWLVERGHLEFNPCRELSRYKEKPKTTYLSVEELAKLGSEMAVTKANPGIVLALRVILCTGVRINECLGMHDSEVGPDGWIIPPKRTKSGREFLTYLPGDVRLNVRLRRQNTFAGVSADAVRQALKRMCKRAGIREVSPHDLRRTVATLLAREGVAPDIRKRILNHAAQGVTDRHYNVHDYANEKRAALAQIVGVLRVCGVLGQKVCVTEVSEHKDNH